MLIVEDSFEGGGYTVGSPPPSPWVVTTAAGGGTVTVENDPASGSPRGQVLKVFEGLGAGSTTSHDEAKLPLGTTKDKITAVFEWRPLTTSRTLYFGVYVSSTFYPILKLAADAHVKYFNSSSAWVNLPTDFIYGSVTWMKVRLVIDRLATSAELVSVTINELDKNSSALNLPNITAAIDGIAFQTDDTEDDGTWWVNNVQVIDKDATVSGTVVDENNAPVSGARIYLLRHTTNVIQASTFTNMSGQYSFTTDSGLYLGVGGALDTGSPNGGSARNWIWAR